MSKRKHYIAVSVLIVVGAVLLYFALTAIYQLPVAASDEAGIIDNMFNVYFGLIAFMFALIMVIMLYAAFAFRRKPGDTEDAAHIHGHTGLEITWTVLPVLLVIALGVWGATTLSALTSSKPDEMAVKVIGQQWSWGFSYPDYDGFDSGQLVLPVDQPIRLEMQSKDVLHSFWVPEFRVKQDLMPGRETILRVTPTEVGEFNLLCAEICGNSHTDMIALVRVVSRTEFEAWTEEKMSGPNYAELTPEERGAIWYSNDGGFGCAGCHTVNGAAGAGPTWLQLYGRVESLADGSSITVDDEYIIDSILQPNAQLVAGFNPNVMPQTYEASFAEKQAEILADQGVELNIIDDLIAFIQTLNE